MEKAVLVTRGDTQCYRECPLVESSGRQEDALVYCHPVRLRHTSRQYTSTTIVMFYLWIQMPRAKTLFARSE
jgi:hypothetical protein